MRPTSRLLQRLLRSIFHRRLSLGQVPIWALAGYANGFHSFDDLAGAFLGYPGLSNDQSKGFAAGGTLGINWQTGSLVY